MPDVARPYFRTSVLRPHAGGLSYMPQEIAALYNFPKQFTGLGQGVAVIQLGGSYDPAALDDYFRGANLKSPKIHFVGIQGVQNTPSQPNPADTEVMMDVAIVGAVANDAEIWVYKAPNTSAGFAGAITAAANNPAISVISISWGGPEIQWSARDIQMMEAAFTLCRSNKISVFAAAGDDGSTDGQRGDNVDYPSSSPQVVGCGGTSLIARNGAISSETVWNDGAGGGATGGGISRTFAIPIYQKAIGVPGVSRRGVPDIAGDASPATGYIIPVSRASGGGTMTAGGTSAVSPLYAGLAACLNQAIGGRVGDLHEKLYATPNVFVDVLTGNNGTYTARAGYDCCTGMGRIDGSKLLAALDDGPPLPPTTTPPPVTLPPTQGAPAKIVVYDAAGNVLSSWSPVP